MRISLVGALLVALSVLPARAQNLLQNGDFGRAFSSWSLPESGVVASVVDAQAGANTKALRLILSPPAGAQPWSIIARQNLAVPLQKGDALKFKAYLRSPQSLSAYAFVEADDAKNSKSLAGTLALSPEWKEYELQGVALADYPVGQVSVGFHLGFGAGVVEMTGLQLQVGNPKPGALAAAPLNPISLDKPQILVPNGDFGAGWEKVFRATGPAASQIEVVASDLPQFSRVLRATTVVGADTKPYEARLGAERTAVPIARFSVVGVRFRARAPQPLRLGVAYQEATAPHAKFISQSASLTPQWQEFRFYGIAPRDFAPDTSNFEFHLGYESGALEIADVRVENFGSVPLGEVAARFGAQTIDYWGGQAHDDGWKKAALERIEKHRKGDLQISIVDAKGQPIPNAPVKITQTRSKFRFGSAVVANRLLDTQNPDNLRYQAEVARLFNVAVFENDMKWNNDAARGAERSLAALPWLKAKGIEVRGHNFVWGSRKYLPDEADALWEKPEELRALVRKRVREAATSFKGQLYVWDAVNEAATNTELWELLGWDEFAQVFKIAREVDPSARLAYNDYNISNESSNPKAHIAQRRRIAELVELLKVKGAPVDIYGDQAHIGLPLTPIHRVIEIWDEVAKLGLPIEITEFDASIPDDAVHAEYVRDFLLASFAQPQIESFVMWGFWEGAHWRAAEGGAMFRRDWTPRPAQTAVEELVLRDWMTKVELVSDQNGMVKLRGFAGDYQISVASGGKIKVQSATLPPTGASVAIALDP